MNFENNTVKNIRIAFIGGGSRGWAWTFMSELARTPEMSGEVMLYDIDENAACANEKIGNSIYDRPDAVGKWKYKACTGMKEALTGADFVVISILPGTFDEMESDVHAPEKYGIYQSVGDTTGPGGVIRALRTVPMFFEFAEAIEKYCPEAWVINYTNPMALCVNALYTRFPKIKAFGCCHEVFTTQKILVHALEEFLGVKAEDRSDIKINIVGVNHFTWINKAYYKNINLMELYRQIADKYHETGYIVSEAENNLNSFFRTTNRVKLDLFREYGWIAAAGDRHLAEYMPAERYLKDPETVAEWGFALTPVSWRKEDLKKRLEKREALLNGSVKFDIWDTGEEGPKQMMALLGLKPLVTNVNLVNCGQIPNLPLGAVVETNAAFRDNMLNPVMAGEVPENILPNIKLSADNQLLIMKAFEKRDLNYAYEAFKRDNLVNIDDKKSAQLFEEMIKATEKYLGFFGLS